jgi:triosephosphate isomerase (TIM)
VSVNKLIVGNWKMNGAKAALAEVDAMKRALAIRSGTVAHQIAICPPATLLASLAESVAGSPIKTGGQDCHSKPSGAHTGDVSAAMLADAGASYVIVGHSERRADHGETSDMVCAKAKAAIASGLIPIICVGETQEIRDAGLHVTVVLDQVMGSVSQESGEAPICIAYEPVWAIGTGRVASAGDVEQMHAAIREALKTMFGEERAGQIPLLYGGSVNSSNAAELLAVPNVDGALVGGASLKAESFLAILNALQ